MDSPYKKELDELIKKSSRIFFWAIVSTLLGAIIIFFPGNTYLFSLAISLILGSYSIFISTRVNALSLLDRKWKFDYHWNEWIKEIELLGKYGSNSHTEHTNFDSEPK